MIIEALHSYKLAKNNNIYNHAINNQTKRLIPFPGYKLDLPTYATHYATGCVTIVTSRNNGSSVPSTVGTGFLRNSKRQKALYVF